MFKARRGGKEGRGRDSGIPRKGNKMRDGDGEREREWKRAECGSEEGFLKQRMAPWSVVVCRK